jgi:hypothetical protein
MKDQKSEPQDAGGGYIRRGKQSSNFSVLPNSLLQDPRLDFRQIGLMANILSRPADWRCRVWELSLSDWREGRDAVRASLRRLRELGYVSLIHERDHGRIRSVYVVYSNPKDNDTPDIGSKSPEPENPSPVGLHQNHASCPPEPEKPASVKPASENPSPYKDVIHKELNEKEKTSQKQQQVIEKIMPVPAKNAGDASELSAEQSAALAIMTQHGCQQGDAIDILQSRVIRAIAPAYLVRAVQVCANAYRANRTPINNPGGWWRGRLPNWRTTGDDPVEQHIEKQRRRESDGSTVTAADRIAARKQVAAREAAHQEMMKKKLNA